METILADQPLLHLLKLCVDCWLVMKERHEAISGSRALQQQLDSSLLGVADMGANRSFSGTRIM